MSSFRRFKYDLDMSESVICRDPEVMGGTPVFCGTRVPAPTLIEYLEAGDSIDEFLEGFPTVTREQVIASWAPHSRHGRACPGHPRLDFLAAKKAWMPATSAGMTN
jgi:uncharacterized protein (DUF433 family)